MIVMGGEEGDRWKRDIVVAAVVAVVAVVVGGGGGDVEDDAYGEGLAGYWGGYGYGYGASIGNGRPCPGLDQIVGYEVEIEIDVEDDAPDATFARVSSDRKPSRGDGCSCSCCFYCCSRMVGSVKNGCWQNGGCDHARVTKRGS